MVSYDAPEEIRYHTCGQVLRDAVIKITDRKGNILPTGETGEVICYVPWVMKGYIGEPGLTAQMFDENGYFLTGDIGHLDENGSLIINGRKKDLIIRGGYNIFPAELEQVLLSLPEVQETCVMGCKDALLGERIVAFVKLTDETVSPQQIRQSASHHIAKYKLPDQIIPLKSIPKLPNGKIDCPALKAIFKKEKISG